ncbi:hypothetical protein [Rickettsia endosymbiont of Aspidapion aeneum]|uniref:hypothetical protein n=1 Tax=Rickettsia endosymbiont of Aspidapion aeneum TaxID=3066247 RepID=UPI00313C29DD
MYSNFFKFLSEVQRIKFPTIISIAIGYFVIGLLLFNYYDQKITNTKSLFLDNNYKLILETSLNKLQTLTFKLNTNLKTSHISLNNNYIKICENEKCINYRLHKFQSLLEQSIPNFNNFKIELNNSLLYSNSISENYEIEKIYYLNQDNKLLISTSIDNNYWKQVVKDIMKPFWFMIAFLSFSFIVLCYLYSALLKKYDRELKVNMILQLKIMKLRLKILKNYG